MPWSALSDQGQPPSSQADTAAYRLLVLGDSLSAAYGLKQHQGWVSLLQNIWRDDKVPIDVVNAAISGETTDGGLARLPRLLEQHNPSHVLIELGGNDGLQGHPVDKLKANLTQMITLAKASDATVLLQDMQIPTNYGKRYTDMFSQAFDDVAAEQNVVLVPFFLESIALDPSLMQRDKIHPNADAQPQIAEWMNTTLKPLILPAG
ncbi:arylesterase [Alteromonas sp. ASW11-19]|uniref:Arylesterase n=1 Tax=Alteromonas salexigens TaxID=2982530 RepID=A0ABT2VQX1_9ALTE|nr:arylesterase [Alteromonas salexigens]